MESVDGDVNYIYFIDNDTTSRVHAHVTFIWRPSFYYYVAAVGES